MKCILNGSVTSLWPGFPMVGLSFSEMARNYTFMLISERLFSDHPGVGVNQLRGPTQSADLFLFHSTPPCQTQELGISKILLTVCSGSTQKKIAESWKPMKERKRMESETDRKRMIILIVFLSVCQSFLNQFNVLLRSHPFSILSRNCIFLLNVVSKIRFSERI